MAKETIIKTKRQTAKWEKIAANHVWEWLILNNYREVCHANLTLVGKNVEKKEPTVSRNANWCNHSRKMYGEGWQNSSLSGKAMSWAQPKFQLGPHSAGCLGLFLIASIWKTVAWSYEALVMKQLESFLRCCRGWVWT